MTDEEMAEEMILKFLEYCNLPWDDHQDTIERDYVLEYSMSRLGHPLMPTQIIHLDLAVADELNQAQLLGVYEAGELVHLTSEVDTSWREVGYSDYPSGLINEDNPWKRSWKFSNPPEAPRTVETDLLEDR
jgi:hypothetical protein